MKDIVYFDLESRLPANKVGGWSTESKQRMGISVAVTYSTRLGEYRIYQQEETEELVEQLRRADLVVGYNHIDFDYNVVKGQLGLFCNFDDQTTDLDMCAYVDSKMKFRPKLDAISQSCLKLGKTAVGTQALVWWDKYQKTGDPKFMMEIARYCCFDVKVTMAVHQFGCKHGYIEFPNRQGDILRLDVDWSTDWDTPPRYH